MLAFLGVVWYNNFYCDERWERMDIRGRLFEMQDPGYKAFQARLMPTVEPAAIIGVLSKHE